MIWDDWTFFAIKPFCMEFSMSFIYLIILDGWERVILPYSLKTRQKNELLYLESGDTFKIDVFLISIYSRPNPMKLSKCNVFSLLLLLLLLSAYKWQRPKSERGHLKRVFELISLYHLWIFYCMSRSYQLN